MTMMQNRCSVEFAGIPTPGVMRDLGSWSFIRRCFLQSQEKIHPELLPPAAADCAWGVRLMERRSKKEDEKLSTEAGQVQTLIPLIQMIAPLCLYC